MGLGSERRTCRSSLFPPFGSSLESFRAKTCHAWFSRLKRLYQHLHDDTKTQHAGMSLRKLILGHAINLMHLNISIQTNDGSTHYSTCILFPICSEVTTRMWLLRVSARLLPICVGRGKLWDTSIYVREDFVASSSFPDISAHETPRSHAVCILKSTV